jgi:ABC-type Co2+ transport system permease subunit
MRFILYVAGLVLCLALKAMHLQGRVPYAKPEAEACALFFALLLALTVPSSKGSSVLGLLLYLVVLPFPTLASTL